MGSGRGRGIEGLNDGRRLIRTPDIPQGLVELFADLGAAGGQERGLQGAAADALPAALIPQDVASAPALANFVPVAAGHNGPGTGDDHDVGVGIGENGGVEIRPGVISFGLH